MAAFRRGQPPLSVHLPSLSTPTLLPDLPPISALFLIDFDVKAGYTIIWKRAIPGLELEGVVEYKSLPSGLHTVPDDLIYFVHDGGYAGLSAFINTKTDEEETRHARMIAVGVLVPLSYGRLGRAWRHADALKEMARQLTTDRKQTDILTQYWEANSSCESLAPQPFGKTPPTSPNVSFKGGRPGKGHSRTRSASDGGALIPPGHRLSPYHPAWSLTSLLDTFGPLIFPIHRAALLRKRILISTHAPVHEVCNFVYDISVLSNIPLSVFDLLDPGAPVQRLKPLFTIGVHDIASLLEHQAASKNPDSRNDESSAIDDSASGWIACTTDSILTMKEELWDMLIVMPPAYAANAKEKVWPTVECPKGVSVKATQRDLRRFRSLRLALARLTALSDAIATATTPASAGTSPSEVQTPLTTGIRLSRPGTATTNSQSVFSEDDIDKVVEPSTWAALAYSGFMWWASAGEQRRGEEAEEATRDAALFAQLTPLSPKMQRSSSFAGPLGLGGVGLADSVSSLTARRMFGGEGSGGGGTNASMDGDDEQARIELAIIAYFHRFTTQMLSVLANIIDTSDDDDMLGIAATDGSEDSPEGTGLLRRPVEGGDSHDWVRVDSEALANMGLDMWSKSDADFVREFVPKYFGRRPYVEGKGVEVCGLRVC